MVNQQIHCAVCKTPLLDENGEGYFAEIRQGHFYESETFEGDNDSVFCDNLKCNVFICPECYLGNPDFCKFMNKIGCQIR